MRKVEKYENFCSLKKIQISNLYVDSLQDCPESWGQFHNRLAYGMTKKKNIELETNYQQNYLGVSMGWYIM